LFSQTAVEQYQIENPFSVALFPNPMQEQTTIQFYSKKPGEIEFSIFNIKGQKIYSRKVQNSAGGKQQLIWTGRDYNENDVLAGVYLYRIQAGAKKQYGKILKLK
jgi:hypothetical protein